MALTKKRRALLIELERIVGSQCWNDNTRNGEWDQGRQFRYPIRFPQKKGRRVRPVMSRLSGAMLLTGHYVFGANKLFIFRALNRVLRHLEKTHGLRLEDVGDLMGAPARPPQTA